MSRFLSIYLVLSFSSTALAVGATNCLTDEVNSGLSGDGHPAPLSSHRLSSWQALPPATSAPLPTEFLSKVSNSSTMRLLKEAHGDGSNLVIYLDSYDESNFHTGLVGGTAGEQMQSAFLSKFVRFLFPRTTVRGRLDIGKFPEDNGKLKFQFAIRDSAEGGRAPLAPTSTFNSTSGIKYTRLEMSSLKAANPGPGIQSKMNLRASMNLPLDSRVASVYGSLKSRPEELIATAKTLLDSSSADIVIMSKPGMKGVGEIKSAFHSDQSITVVTATDFQGLVPKMGERFVIINDSQGRMPYVHSAADYTIAIGQGNLYESINVGTPTFFFPLGVMPEIGTSYNSSTWSDMTAVAIATGNGHLVPDREALPALVRSHSDQKPGKFSYEMDARGVSPFGWLMSAFQDAFLPSGQSIPISTKH